ncbi:rRNA small subunit methyltransferase H [Fulvivirga imtechensis AK7]|uniref:Ribosomal RNA small subunit methyltransferase H n=2 Tax=Fulvivirga TaxID=396811 RepID=L8JUE8_9BACT|nr:rRNA small subunit methyltransferase H [Fulvivirga imtechensis AK7]
MLKECIDGLDIKPDGVYVDLTFGGGGHSKAILEKLKGGHLYAFDQDQDAKQNAQQIKNSSFTFIEGNFRYLKRYLKMYGVKAVDGILGDLGVSSHQIDDAERGFSTRFDAELDMRMDRSAAKTARQVINEYSQEELHRILGMYGEVRNAKTLAAAIVAARVNAEISTINDLKHILSRYAKRGKENKYYAQVFQAIRIEVNEELKALEEMLEQSSEVLTKGGRLVIMSYHSLEDRLVKNFIQKGKLAGEVEKDFYGNVIRPFEAVTRKPTTASDEEIKENNRARSAKLRIAEKL